MQYRPTAEELLGTIADLLGQEVLDVVPGHLTHRVRVAENLSRILQREVALGAAADQREVERLEALLGRQAPLEELRSELTTRLRTSDDPAFDQAALEALVAITREDLAIAKPGHDGWEGQ
jgi:hypothetical protein